MKQDIRDQAIEDLLSETLELEVPRIVIYAAYRYSIEKLVGLAKKLGYEVVRVDGGPVVPRLATLKRRVVFARHQNLLGAKASVVS